MTVDNDGDYCSVVVNFSNINYLIRNVLQFSRYKYELIYRQHSKILYV
jgi:hypothetical protein